MGSGFGVQGLRFRVLVSGFRVQGLRFRVLGPGFKVAWGFGNSKPPATGLPFLSGPVPAHDERGQA